MLNVWVVMLFLLIAGCTNVVPTSRLLTNPSAGEEKLNPSDEFDASSFNSRRWTAYELNSSMIFAQTSEGIKIGGTTQNQNNVAAFKLKANYTVKINDVYGDSVIGELHLALRNAQPDQTGVMAYFENGKRVDSYIYNNIYENKVYGRVDIYAVDGTTLLYASTPIAIGVISQCQEYKLAVNYNADSTSQWNVNFSDNCASLGYVSQIALGHASLGATDYVGNSNGKVRFELYGNRIPVAIDSTAFPFFGYSDDGLNIPLTITEFTSAGQGALVTYQVELLNWNFSVFGSKVTEEK